MRVVRTAEDIITALGPGTPPVILVPTMGALHAGHLDLIRFSKTLGPPVVVSVFVNPSQFNDPADLDRYPRSLHTDATAAQFAGADVIYAPPVEEIYPNGPEATPEGELPDLATKPGLEDRFRPGHFGGVHRVCDRLFELCHPSVAVFGEKDWQQLRLVTHLAAEKHPDLKIIGRPTTREADGLALSSRNRFVPVPDRPRATAVPRAIRAAQAEQDPDAAEAAARAALEAEGLAVEYAAVRDAQTLLRPIETDARVLIAARLSDVRLLDNAPWPAPDNQPR